MSKYKLYKRRGGFFRKNSERNAPGKNWELVKTYKTLDRATEALVLHESRDTWSDGLKRWQYKLVTPQGE